MDLSKAFREGDDDLIIRHLLDAYDICNDPDTLLRNSAHYGRENILKACLEAGINPDKDNALNWACGKGKIDPIKILITFGANVNLKDEYGRTPIMASAGHGKLNEIKYLLKNGADIDGALLAAVDGEYKNVVMFLLEQNVNLEEVSNDRLTCLTIACATHHKKAVEISLMLIKYGANVNYVRESDEQTPLKFAAGNSTPEVIQALINKGAEIDGPEGTTQTALMLAARANSVPNVEVLIKNGSNPKLQCGLKWAENRTAQELAEMENCNKVVQYFKLSTKNNREI